MRIPAFALAFFLASLPAALSQEEDPKVQARSLLEEGDRITGEFEVKSRDLPPLQAEILRFNQVVAAAHRAGDQAALARLQEEGRALQARKEAIESALRDLFARAIAAFDKATLLDPVLGQAYTGRATLKMAVGDLDGGAKDLQKAVELAPDEIKNYSLRAIYRFGTMDWDGSWADAERCMAAGHKTDRMREIESQILFYRGKFAEAAALYDEFAKAGNAQAAEIAKIARQYATYLEEELGLQAKEKEKDDLPRVKFVTDKGEIVLELFEDQAPNTVANFVALVEKGFYDGMKFHRVIPNFMAQCGDPNSKDEDPANDGQGGPGYRVKDETGAGFRRHFPGVLSMANTGQPNTGGSQFFITFVPTTHLDGKHTAFGRVTEGMDVLFMLRKGTVLTKAVVLRKREHPYEPETMR